MKVKYGWSSTWGVINTSAVTAQKTGERLAALRYKKGSDSLTPADIVQDARPKRSPMHDLFTWVDEAAANKWREHQARFVLHSIRIVQKVDGLEQHIIANVHIKNEEGEHAYVPISVAINQEGMREQVMAEALRYLKGFQDRYAHLAALRPIIDAIDQVQGGLNDHKHQE